MQPRSERNCFLDLADDVYVHLLTFLPANELFVLKRVSKDWARVLSRTDVWRSVFIREFGDRAKQHKAKLATSQDLHQMSWQQGAEILCRESYLALLGREFKYQGKWGAQFDQSLAYEADLFITSNLASKELEPLPQDMKNATFHRCFERLTVQSWSMVEQRIQRAPPETHSEFVKVQGYVDWTLTAGPITVQDVVGQSGREYVIGYFNKRRRILEIHGFTYSPGTDRVVINDDYQLELSADGLSCQGVSRSMGDPWTSPVYFASATLQDNVLSVIEEAFEEKREHLCGRVPDFDSMFDERIQYLHFWDPAGNPVTWNLDSGDVTPLHDHDQPNQQ